MSAAVLRHTEEGMSVEVLGQQATEPEVAGQQATNAPPTAVDAGMEGQSSTPLSSVPLLLTFCGAMLAGLAMLIRRCRA